MMIPLAPSGPGQGPQWDRLASWLRHQVAGSAVDGIWVFRVLRHGQKEFGTAVLSVVDGERRRIFTATYSATIKGKQRGGFVSDLIEVGTGPLETLQEVLALVPMRADDEEPPEPVGPALWFPADVPDAAASIE
jgi:hypothetical protein